MSGLVVITRDLMDGGRVRREASDATVVSTHAHPAVADATTVVLDLRTGIDPAVVVAVGPPVIAYGPHVDTEALAAALAAGCTEALPRSVIFRRLGELG